MLKANSRSSIIKLNMKKAMGRISKDKVGILK